ncbi:MAG: citrate synthase [Deltaproteobacteria bacterium]|nr:citrate synthase [Deltaproteobacteria bacterium]
MGHKATLTVDGKSYELDVIEGTEGERAIDITKLREKSGLVTLDPGYVNTGSTRSAITFIDGEAGVLRYRGYPIEELAAKSSFVETSYLLIHGELPSKPQLQAFSERLAWHTMLHEDMKFFFNGFPMTAHPMAILSSMVSSLSSFYPELLDIGDEHARWETYPRLLSKLRTIAAFSYKKTVGEPFLYPPWHLSYCAKILYMMFAIPTKDYDVDPEFERALNLLLILHADHEQNCSTSTVRLVGSAEANLFASISAGILALWGPLHGGANQEVMEMLELIRQDGMNVAKYVDQAKDKNSGFRLMGFGHRVYKNYDPRAKILRETCDRVLARMRKSDPLLDIAKKLEEVALKDEYFIERKLYPNVDFYSGIIYRAMGIPTNMFTVMFALGRLPGWIAQWKEMIEMPGRKIGRPRQIYTGPTARSYVTIDQRP